MFKELEIMKALRYLLIAVILSTASLLSVANATAQSLAQLPDNEMRSTSVLPTSGSTLPQAAVDGVTTTEEQESSSHHGAIRKERPGDWTNPYDDPIGDAGWTLLFCAAVFSGVIAFRRKRQQRNV
jgi:hypothetical protein